MEFPKKIPCPLSFGEAKLIQTIFTAPLIEKYIGSFGYDPKENFGTLNQIGVYECVSTGYKFFYPYHIEGKADLYKKLQEYAWYYMPWKWEHTQALTYIKPGMKVLEVGCGAGGFLEGLWKERKIKGVGIELNSDTVRKGIDKGLDLRGEDLADFSKESEDQFDLVCSFQVLEHISQVDRFLGNQIKCIKPGGYLVVSVPNNEGFIKDDFNLLNVPPHHMGLWEEHSLRRTGDLFGLKHVATHFEPLQDYHRGYFLGVLQKKLPRVFVWLASRLKLEKLLFSKRYRAFTILMVWQK